ncbi:hypothetical protein P9281_02225 [Caballeronia sp. LP003]|uniref:hypothetical protein n=1 Tax=Caballeronia sp. LP003 TaxID=3038551 RepID=UPI002860DCF9|nr:hypothetical protein [Caballeronia sp. LP003]MDR5785372.1 hypothetical protein [Caballeronia sp. LP003]
MSTSGIAYNLGLNPLTSSVSANTAASNGARDQAARERAAQRAAEETTPANVLTSKQFAELMQNLKTKSGPLDEYESRFDRYARIKLLGTGKYEVVIDPGKQFDFDSCAQLKFDPESGTLEIVWKLRGKMVGSSSDQIPYRTIKIRKSLHDGGDYIGTNAYGATRNVSSIRESGSALMLMNMPTAKAPYSIDPDPNLDILLRESVSMTGAEARRVVPRLKVRVTFAPVARSDRAAIVDHDFEYLRPTLDDPTALSIDTDYLYANLLRVELFDPATNKVLSDYVPQGRY